ncbi:MAG: peptide MFS transporter, partial [Saprospiraceae bacterium]|nr:peptide MFS transporter [Saprospiraceae bacterium]MCB0622907.1 peptide MFS transporter [Saprospiraceae bacterium]MCB0679842.1 peptide MFS transporter [Saprospiraceae bacterium]
MDSALGLLIGGWIFVLVWVPIIIISQRKIHPKALFALFFTELWERFSFYGMRALLVLYMTKVLFEQMEQGQADARAYGIYGAFNALLYAAPVIGGLLADRLLGFRKAIIIGGLFMALGQFTLAGTVGDQTLFFIGLALITVGNGLFKPNISSFLGTFYSQDDPKKDGAFTIFYMGINIGAFLAPLTCGYLGEKYDWSYGFLAAGIGILVGLVQFYYNMKDYEDKGNPPDPEYLNKPVFLGLNRQWLTVLGCIVVIPLFALLINAEEVMNLILFIAGIGIIGYLVVDSVRNEDKVEGQRLLVVIVL